jgi:hypothetical protein
MKIKSKLTGFAFTDTSAWAIFEGRTYPLLRAFLKPLTIAAKDTTKVYDRNAFTGGRVSYSPSNVDPTQILGTPVFADSSQGAINAGKFPISISGLYSTQQGYWISYSPGVLTVQSKPLTITGAVAQNKIYDGTVVAAVTYDSLLGRIPGDTVTVTLGTASFATKDTGTAKTVTVSGYAMTGKDEDNYELDALPTGLTANITPKPLTITGAAAVDRSYDGTTTATILGASLAGAIPGDKVALVLGTATFATKDMGKAKPVTASGYSITGEDAGNYYPPIQPANLSATIYPKSIYITVTASDKVYDGTVAAAVTYDSLVGRIPGDTVTVTLGTASFATKDTGTAKTVTVFGYSITGTDADNYVAWLPTGLTANITQKAITVTADAKKKSVGMIDPPLTYTAPALFGTDAWTGSLTRDAGDTEGDYPIRLGTLSAGGNYAITFVGADLSISHTDGLVVRPAMAPLSRDLAANIRRAFAPVATGKAQAKIGDVTGGDDETRQVVDVVLPGAASVTVSIFDNLGNAVISWSRDVSAMDVRQFASTGDGRWILPVSWNARAWDGSAVPAGVYLWKIVVVTEGGQKLETVKKLGVR